jgi:hypothetical protein
MKQMKLDLSLCGLRVKSRLDPVPVFCFPVFALTAALQDRKTATPNYRSTAAPQH